MTGKDMYIYNFQKRIWSRPEMQTIPYSDGDQAEEYLLSVLKNARDISASSPELISLIKDWPSEYHLSTVRHNLLRPFNIQRSDYILELGCGCGSLSRYLGETGASVVAVEGSGRRAQIAAERCRDLANVKIFCDNINEFVSDKKFDFVLLIGVFEYSDVFITSKDPFRSCLERARFFLKESGILILAIENQLGLKYFNGCTEDHTNIPYFGLHDLYHEGSPFTFGKRELTAKLQAAGFENLSFFYPFPDYKLPKLILSDQGLDHEPFRPADLLYRIASRDYTGYAFRNFTENLAWQPIVRTGLLPELANSFLVWAAQTSSSRRPSPDMLASLYSTERLPQFATETVFRSRENAIHVTKRHLFDQMPKDLTINGMRLYHQSSTLASYSVGKLYAIELQKIIGRNPSVTELAKHLKPWIDHLINNSTSGSTGKRTLPESWLDAIPANFIRTSSGKIDLIDLEWVFDQPAPLAWILIRGMMYTLTSSFCASPISELSVKEITNQILELSGYTPLTDLDFHKTALWEEALQKIVYGTRSVSKDFSKMLETPLKFHTSLPAAHIQISLFEKEVARIKSSFSWQITKPIRFLLFVWNFLVQHLTGNRKKGNH